MDRYDAIVGVESQYFDRQLINNFLHKCPEGPLFDRKSQLYKLNYDRWSEGKLADETIKSAGDFIKDVIAMMNSARRRGRSAYIVFGVNDDWEIVGNGVVEQCTRDLKEDSMRRFLASAVEFGKLQTEVIEKQDMRPSVSKCIQADPWSSMDYHYGWITYKGVQSFIAYLRFRPSSVKTPYMVKDNLSTKLRFNLGLNEDRCWTRTGESNEIVKASSIDELRSLLPLYTEVPFVPIEEWDSYLEKLISEHSSFRSIDHGELEQFGSLSLLSQTKSASKKALTRVLYDFATSVDAHSNLLILQARGGAGKSAALQELVRQLASTTYGTINVNRKVDYPQGVIPVYVPLADNGDRPATAADLVKKRFKDAVDTDSTPSDIFPKLFSDRELQFLIVFDGLDEVSPDLRQTFAAELFAFADDHPWTRVVIATRPDVLPKSKLTYRQCVSIEPLTLPQAKEAIAARGFPKKTTDVLYRWLDNDPSLLDLLSIPRTLTIFLNEVSRVSHLSLGVLLDAVTSAQIEKDCERLILRQRVKYRNELLDVAEHAVFSDLSLNYVEGLQNFEYFTENGYLEVDIKKGHVRLFSRYVGEVLVATRILEDPEFAEIYKSQIAVQPLAHAGLTGLMANITPADLTDAEFDFPSWLRSLNDPVTEVRVYLDRRNPSLKHFEHFGEAVGRLAEFSRNFVSSPRADISELISVAFNDPNPQVFLYIVEELKTDSALRKHLTVQELEDIVRMQDQRFHAAYSVLQLVSPDRARKYQDLTKPLELGEPEPKYPPSPIQEELGSPPDKTIVEDAEEGITSSLHAALEKRYSQGEDDES